MDGRPRLYTAIAGSNPIKVMDAYAFLRYPMKERALRQTGRLYKESYHGSEQDLENLSHKARESHCLPQK